MISVTQSFVDESKKEFGDVALKVYNTTRSKTLNEISNLSIKLSGKGTNNKTTTDTLIFNYIDDDITIFKDDEISCISFFSSEEIAIYSGKVESVTISFTGNKNTYKVKVVDITKELITAEFNEDTSFYDVFLCNNLDKDNSLLHKLASLAGLTESQMLFDDIKVNNEYVKLTVFLATKGETIVSYITQISTEYVANSFANKDNKQIFKTGYSETVVVNDYEFNETNTMQPLLKTPVMSSFNSIELSYVEYVVAETETSVFKTTEDLSILANSSSNIIEITYSSEFVSGPNVQNLVIKDDQGVEQDTSIATFVLNSDKTVLTVNNINDFDVYISFDIYAKSIKQIEKQTRYNKNPAVVKYKTLSAEYIQDETTADEVAKWLYNYYCEDKNTYTFKSTMSTFLEINDIVKLKVDSKGIDELIVIKNITYSKDDRFTMSITADSYIVPDFQDLLLTKIESLKQSDSNLTTLQNDILQNAEDISNAETMIDGNTTLIKTSDDEVIFRILSGKVPQFNSLASQFKMVNEGFEFVVEDVGEGVLQPVKKRTTLAISVDGIEAEVFDVDDLGVKYSKVELNAENITATVGRVTTAENTIVTQGTQISANSSAIVLRATQTEMNSVSGRVSSAESAISINSTNINLKVSKSDIISEINLSSEGIRISGDNITLDGDTVVNGDFEINGDLLINGTLNAETKIINNTITNDKIIDVAANKILFYESGIVMDDIGTVDNTWKGFFLSETDYNHSFFSTHILSSNRAILQLSTPEITNNSKFRVLCDGGTSLTASEITIENVTYLSAYDYRGIISIEGMTPTKIHDTIQYSKNGTFSNDETNSRVLVKIGSVWHKILTQAI